MSPIRAFETRLPTTARKLFEWHARPGAFDRLKPPWQPIEIETPAPVEDGARAHLRMKKGPFWISWIAEHRDVDDGRGFTDVQVKGPFASWTHRHEFEDAPAGAILRDRIEYSLPGGALGRVAAGKAIAHDLEATFSYRHETTRRDLARHARFEGPPPLRIAVTGGSGLVGSSLVPFLRTGGHDVVELARGESGVVDSLDPATHRWSTETGLLRPEAVEPFDALVHLAGENVASRRWSREQKNRIRASRTDGTRNLVRSLARLKRPPKTLVSASAIGYFGSRGEEILDEGSAAGSGFLAETAQEWEQVALEAEALGIRVVLLRFGIILSPAGGALAKMLLPFRLGVGGVLGSGRQFMSWISIDDAIAAIQTALLDPTLRGPVNAVAPAPVRNREFTRTLGRVLRRPTPFPLPAAAARILFGEMADEMLLAGARARPSRLESSGFVFEDPDLESALRRLLGKVVSP